MQRSRRFTFSQTNPLGIALTLMLVLLSALAWGKESDVRLEVARKLSEKGEYDKAVLELRRYLSEHPEATDIYARIGNLRFKQGNFKLAGENFKIALAKNPNLSEAREGLAKAYEMVGEKAKAAEIRAHVPKIVQKPVKLNSSIPPSTSLQRIEESDFSPALDSVASNGQSGIYTQKEFLEALRLYREKKSDSALGWLRKCLAKSPKHPGAYYLGGVIRYEKGEYAKSIFNFKRSFDYPERGFNANYYLGRIYQKQDRYNDAIEAFEKYLPLSKSVEGKRQVEALLKQMGAIPDTTKDSSHTSAADTTQSSAHEAAQPVEASEKSPAPQVKAVLLVGEGAMFFIIPDKTSASGKKLVEAWDACLKEKYEKAENILKETAMVYGGSDNAEAASLDLASVYLQLGLWENALGRLSVFLGGIHGDSSKYMDGANYLIALAELGHKNGEKAEKYLLRIKPGGEFGPKQDEVDYRLAMAGELLKDNKKWAGYLEKAYASAKTPLRRAELTQKLGLLHSHSGSADKAMDYFRKSMGECPEAVADTLGKSEKQALLEYYCTESSLRLADLAFKKKDWKAALAYYRQFATKYPDHKESAWVHYQMANIYKTTNNFESALNEYKRVIDNYPDSYWSSQAKWKREDTIWQKEYEEVLD